MMDVREMTKFLRAAGKSITPQRKLLLRIIDRNAHLDASEIYHLAKEQDPKISLSTVYRTLTLLKDLGLVRSNGLGEDHHHYEILLEKHYHLVCLRCGKVVEIPPVKSIRELGEEQGFEVIGAKLELVGYCEKCRKEREREMKRASPSITTGRPTLLGMVTRTIDLRDVPLLEHPRHVSRELKRLETGEFLEIITDDPTRLEMAPKMLGEIEKTELLKIWREGNLCHTLVKRV